MATMAVYLGFLGWDFRVDAPQELVAAVRALARRFERALPEGPAEVAEVIPGRR
jgi:hypothetical protein